MNATSLQRYSARSIETPLGALVAVADDAGALVRLDFAASPRRPRTPASTAEEWAARGVTLTWEARPFAALERALARYFDGRRETFDLPCAARGTSFQHEVWAALRAIPFGATRSYAELARAIGRPRAVRAVGRANATNPLSIVVPCHRVIGSDGALTGYAGGVERKHALLALEARSGERSR